MLGPKSCHFPVLFACPFLLVCLLRLSLTLAATEKYNVLFLIIDDLKTELGSYGNDNLSFTPNLDAFASTGVQFNKAYAQVALCGPSRASLFTGRTPRSLDYFQHQLSDVRDQDIITRSPISTLPKMFQAQGYSTRGAGKVFHTQPNLDQFQKSRWSESVQCPCNSASETCPKMTCTVTSSEVSALEDSGTIQWGKDQLTDLAKSSGNFFMALGIRKPHLPYRMPLANMAKVLNVFGNDINNIPLPDPKSRQDSYSLANYFCDAVDGYLSTYAATTTRSFSSSSSLSSLITKSFNGSTNYTQQLLDSFCTKPEDSFPNVSYSFSENDFELPRKEVSGNSLLRAAAAASYSTQLGSEALPDDFIRQFKLGYFASVSWVDDLVADILAKLSELNLDTKTIVVVVGDNGFNLGEQGNYCKNNNYETSTRVPLIIKHPKGRTNVKINEIVSLIDIYPTLLDLAGIKSGIGADVLAQLHGSSFSSLVTDSAAVEKVSDDTSKVSYSGVFRCMDFANQIQLNCNAYTKVNAIGYSVRSSNFRYTEWREFESASPYLFTSAAPVIFTELYDHTLDFGFTLDKVDIENLALALTLKVSTSAYSIAELQNKIAVYGNLIKSQFSCASQNCVPISNTLFPTPFPTNYPTQRPTRKLTHSPTASPSRKSSTLNPTTFPLDAQQNSILPTSFPTLFPEVLDQKGSEKTTLANPSDVTAIIIGLVAGILVSAGLVCYFFMDRKESINIE